MIQVAYKDITNINDTTELHSILCSINPTLKKQLDDDTTIMKQSIHGTTQGFEQRTHHSWSVWN